MSHQPTTIIVRIGHSMGFDAIGAGEDWISAMTDDPERQRELCDDAEYACNRLTIDMVTRELDRVFPDWVTDVAMARQPNDDVTTTVEIDSPVERPEQDQEEEYVRDIVLEQEISAYGEMFERVDAIIAAAKERWS